jgi:hypothetical protein
VDASKITTSLSYAAVKGEEKMEREGGKTGKSLFEHVGL